MSNFLERKETKWFLGQNGFPIWLGKKFEEQNNFEITIDKINRKQSDIISDYWDEWIKKNKDNNKKFRPPKEYYDCGRTIQNIRKQIENIHKEMLDKWTFYQIVRSLVQ